MPNPYPFVPMSPVTRDSETYWRSRPTDHNTVGLFIDGPQMTEPFTNQLARLIRSVAPEPAEGPLGARQRMTRQRRQRLTLLERQAHFLAEITRGRSRAALRTSGR